MTKNKLNQGQALITLIFFVLIAVIYISAAIIVIAVNSRSATNAERGVNTSRLAEGALEDTLLRLIRDPNYAGATFDLESGNATVSVSGNGMKTISVSLVQGNNVRKYEAEVLFVETEMSILSWKEVF